ALIFGTLLSSQGTDASFVLTRSNTYWGFPPGFVLRFQPYQIIFRTVSGLVFDPRPLGAFAFQSKAAGPFAFRRSTTLALAPRNS
ncbi:hypothetical protein ACIO7M_29970, partial [Streptomyces toxytricini]